MSHSWIVLAVLAGAVGPAFARDPDPLARYRWNARLVVVSAADAGDPQVAVQRRIVAAATAGFRERDLKLVEAIGSGGEAQAIRQRLGLPGDAFRAVLIGKDGGAKLTAFAPIPAARLFDTVDAMPMRRNEIERRP